MNITETPDGQLWPGQVKLSIGAPPGRDDIGDAPAVIDFWYDGSLRSTVRLELDRSEIEDLSQGAAVWISFLGAPIRPFMGYVGKLPPRCKVPAEIEAGANPRIPMEAADNLRDQIETRALVALTETMEASAKERGLAPDLVERMLTQGSTATLATSAVRAGAAAALEMIGELRRAYAAGSKIEWPMTGRVADNGDPE